MASLLTVRFDQFNPTHQKAPEVQHAAQSVDYSPLRRVTGRSFVLALFVSMGGLMYVFGIYFICLLVTIVLNLASSLF